MKHTRWAALLALIAAAHFAAPERAHAQPQGGPPAPPAPGAYGRGHDPGEGPPGHFGPPPGGPPGMPDELGFGPPLELLKELGLTEGQRSQLAAIHDRQMALAIRAEADLRIAWLELHARLRGDKPDREATRRQVDEIAGHWATLMKIRLDEMLESRAVLTATQLKKLREIELDRVPPRR